MSALHALGALADSHPRLIETIAFGLAFVGVGFLVCPFWARFDRRTGR